MAIVTHHLPGETAARPQVGDILLTVLSAVRFGHETRPSRRSRWARRGRVGRSAFVVAVVGLQHESPLPVR
jgi:hypothetical protein